jgi:adenosylcobinamide-phosphate synthase
VWGDPARLHPVAGFGMLATALESRMYAPTRKRGAAFTTCLFAGVIAAGSLAERAVQVRWGRVLITAATTWAVVGSRSLEGEARAVAGLAAGDLPAARRRLTSLVGRDTQDLDQSGVARAAVESVAENTSDAVVAPLFWGGLLGVRGLAAYRAANTLDAMVGHRNDRYAEFGWASARLDDALNFLPARLSAGLAAAFAPAVGGDPARSLRTWRRDAPGHPSPNAGPVEAAFAGALGIRLGGVNTYAGVPEDRHSLGIGPEPHLRDIDRANELALWVGRGALTVAVSLAALAHRPRRSACAPSEAPRPGH